MLHATICKVSHTSKYLKSPAAERRAAVPLLPHAAVDRCGPPRVATKWQQLIVTSRIENPSLYREQEHPAWQGKGRNTAKKAQPERHSNVFDNRKNTSGLCPRPRSGCVTNRQHAAQRRLTRGLRGGDRCPPNQANDPLTPPAEDSAIRLKSGRNCWSSANCRVPPGITGQDTLNSCLTV